jgi:MFS family permease
MLSPSYKRYALGAITLAYAVSLTDRGFMFILLEPIKKDLQLSDTQLGFVTGFAFSVFYATMGIPIARWADRGNRVSIVSLAMALWSLTTMATLMVTNYVQLLVARILAGIGDAGCLPPMYSLLGDYFRDPAERTRAIYVYELASPFAGLVAFVAAGWLNEHFGWRIALLVAAIPALLIAALLKLTLIEPPRQVTRSGERMVYRSSTKDVLALLWQQPSCRHLTAGMIVWFITGAGVVTWQAAYMIRAHGMGTAELGSWMAVIHAAGSATGILCGAYALGRWFKRDERGQMRLAAFAAAISVPAYIAFLMLPNGYHALLVLIPQAVVFGAFIPATTALLQRLVPDNMRATAFMVIMFLANLIGLGLGPQLVGVLSDLLRESLGRDALREAMLLVSFLGLWTAYHYWRVSRTIQDDLRLVATTQSASHSGDEVGMTRTYAG